jgi:spheroidene monooxygenase
MVGSFHLVTFRRRKLLPPGRSPSDIDGLRFWRALSTGKDPFHSMPPDVSSARLLQPNLREWAFFGVWESEADLDHFVGASDLAESWTTDSAETWTVWLKPISCRGEWPGVQALRDLGDDRLPDAPAALITRLDLPFGAPRAMWFSVVPGIAGHTASVPGLLAGVPIMDRPYVNPMTFSVWSSFDDARSFAYRQAPHQQAVGRLHSAREDVVARFSSARFYPYRSQGTWKGANPLPASAA